MSIGPHEIPRSFLEAEGSGPAGHPAINFGKPEKQENEKWNPVLKYTVVALTAGAGAIMIYHGLFHDVGKSSCDDMEVHCIPDRAVGFVMGGLVLSVVAIGIERKF